VSGSELKQRLAAILAADVAGYSRLMAADERATVAALDTARAVFRTQIESNQGRVIDMAGDSVLAVFETATGAVSAALAVQQNLNAASSTVSEHRRMRFRIGVHLGDVIEKADGTVYGDGVNIAARLEGLAEPGGITVSESIRTAVKGKVDATFGDQGEQQVKNILEPVRAYRVGIERGSAPKPAPAVGEIDISPPDKPSIAVLPFASLSNDPEQAYFAEGLSASLTTDLSRISGLFVIASTSTATFGGKVIDVRQIGRDLGVRYVLQGSVQRGGNKVRMNAQLVEAGTGSQLWSDRFDGDATDLFALQDQITGRIANAIGRQIIVMAARDAEKRKTHPQAADLLVRGIALSDKPLSLERLIEQELLFREALALDPHNADAWARLGRTILLQLSPFANSFTSEQKDEKLREGRKAVEKALALDPNSAYAHYAEGILYRLLGKPVEWARSYEVAIALDRNLAIAYGSLGTALIYLGEPEKAISQTQYAMRLDPLGPQIGNQQAMMGRAYFFLRHSDLAIEWLLKSRTSNPKLTRPAGVLALAYAQKGDDSAARLTVESLLRVTPHYKVADAFDPPVPFSPEAYRKLYDEVVLPAARRAGIPE